MTDLRVKIIGTMQKYGTMLDCLDRGWKVMEVGIAGDEKPGGNYKFFGVGNDYKTLDVVAKYEPDIVADICDTGLEGETWDLIIFSQTIEHIFDFYKAIRESARLLKPSGYLILDCPFVYPYHPEEPDFGDYWRISPTAMQKLLNSVGLETVHISLVDGILTTSLSQKPNYV